MADPDADVKAGVSAMDALKRGLTNPSNWIGLATASATVAINEVIVPMEKKQKVDYLAVVLSLFE